MKKKLIHISISLFCFFVMTGGVISGQETKPDYTSKVPFYKYANTLKDQEEQLKDNILLKRMAISREQLSTDRYRPIYHYVNPEGNLNDPNGLCFWNGNWHLFFQAYPPEDPRQHWGHAISEDLIHWRDLPYAIYPNPERQVYSGSTLVDDDKVIAIYHGTMVGNMVATSSDPLLLNWNKVSGNAVIPLTTKTGFKQPYSVFDPCIWKKDGVYYALSAGRDNVGPGNKPVRANHLFRSKDLENWEYVHEFVEGDRFTLLNDDGACPYFWPIGDKYILNFFSHMSGGQYLIGDYDKENDKFIVTSGGKYNHGAASPGGVHAPSATPDGKGGVIIIFNMNPAKSTQGWNQIMSLPRRLTLDDNEELLQVPAADFSVLHFNEKEITSKKLVANKEIVLNGIKGNAIEIQAEVDMKDSEMVEFNVLRSPKKEEYTRIVIYKEKGYSTGLSYVSADGTATMPADLLQGLTGERVSGIRRTQSVISLETSSASVSPDVRIRPPETAQFFLDKGETVKIQVFVDKSIVEVFVNGKQCVAARVYPDRDDSMGISVKSTGKDAELISLKAWQMKSIY